MLAGDGDFGLFFVVHFEHEAGFEPGDDFLDVVDVDEIGAVRAPEGIGIESGEEFFEGAVVARCLRLRLDVMEMRPPSMEAKMRSRESTRSMRCWERTRTLAGWGGSGLGSGELGDELFEALGGAGLGFDFFFDFLDGFGEAGLVEGF